MKTIFFGLLSITTVMLTLLSCSVKNISPEYYACDGNNEEKEPSIQISTRELCGWSSSFDSLTITGTKITYFCKSDASRIEYHISCTELNSLLNKLDVAAFNKLDIHTCNICVDGCDYSLAVKTDHSFHKITIGGSDDLPVQQQRDFFNRLQAIRDSIAVQHCK